MSSEIFLRFGLFFLIYLVRISQISCRATANLKMSIFGETKCNFSPVSTEVYTALIHHFTCRLEARQALIYQLVLGLTGENGKYNDSKAVHLYPPLFDIFCSAKNYKTAPALTMEESGFLPPHNRQQSILDMMPPKIKKFVLCNIIRTKEGPNWTEI